MNQAATTTWRQAIAADIEAATPSGVAGVVVLVTALFYEWGSGNETVNVSVIANTYESVGGAAGVAAATVVGAIVPAFLQIVTGTIAAIGFGSVTNMTAKAWSTVLRIRPSLKGSSWLGMSTAGQATVAFGLGASVSVLVEQTASGRSGLKAMRPVIVRSAIFTGIGAGLLSLLLSGAAEIARQFDATRPAADWLIKWATNPLVWVVLFTGLAVAAWRSNGPQDVADEALPAAAGEAE